MRKRIIRPGEPGYRQCTITIMDTTDPDITFDQDGVSSWVHYFRDKVSPRWKPEGNPTAFRALIQRIKDEGRSKEYDCAIGLSGGVDSSYLASIAKRECLRPLVVHTDAGWNSDVAVRNIEKIVKICGFDLITVVIDWDEMADLQRAFLRAGVPNQDTPQDHAIFAAFFGLAAKHRIKWVLSGHNFVSESILPSGWGHNVLDVHHIKAIHKLFGNARLESFPLMSMATLGLQYKLLRGMQIVKPLDLIRYDRAEAMQSLEREFGWQYYGGKHFESRWTRFYQGWWLPTQFGYDKRLAHYSSLILSGQLSREAALQEMQKSYYTSEMVDEDRELILKKLGMSLQEWNHLMSSPVHEHDEYPQSVLSSKVYIFGQQILRRIGFSV